MNNHTNYSHTNILATSHQLITFHTSKNTTEGGKKKASDNLGKSYKCCTLK